MCNFWLSISQPKHEIEFVLLFLQMNSKKPQIGESWISTFEGLMLCMLKAERLRYQKSTLFSPRLLSFPSIKINRTKSTFELMFMRLQQENQKKKHCLKNSINFFFVVKQYKILNDEKISITLNYGNRTFSSTENRTRIIE